MEYSQNKSLKIKNIEIYNIFILLKKQKTNYIIKY